MDVEAIILAVDPKVVWYLVGATLLSVSLSPRGRESIKRRVKVVKRTRFLWIPLLLIYFHIEHSANLSELDHKLIYLAFQLSGGAILLFSLNGTLDLIGRGSLWDFIKNLFAMVFLGKKQKWENWSFPFREQPAEGSVAYEIDKTLAPVSKRLENLAQKQADTLEKKLSLLESKIRREYQRDLMNLGLKVNLYVNRNDRLALGGLKAQASGALMAAYGSVMPVLNLSAQT